MQDRTPALLRMLVAGACIVIILAGVKAVAPVLTPFLLALLLAIVLSPIMMYMMKHRVPQGVAVALTLLLVFVGGAAVIALVGTSMTKLASRLPTYATQLVVLRDQLFAYLQSRWGLDTSTYTSLDLLDPGEMVRHAAGIVAVVLTDLGHSFFILLITALLLIECAVLYRQLEEAEPGTRTFVHRFGEMSADIQKYVSITAAVGVVGSVAYMILLKVMGIPFVSTWVVLYFILGFIPAIGGVISIIPVFLVTLLEQGIQRAVVLLVIFILINTFLGEFLKPKFMQKGFEISIVAIFFSLVVWSWLIGPIGMVVAVPFTITIRRLMTEFAPEVKKVLV